MTNLNLITLLMASLYLGAAETNELPETWEDPSLTKEEREEYLAGLAEMGAKQVEGSVNILVLDQLGKPVEGVPVLASYYTQDKIPSLRGRFGTRTEELITTNHLGVVTIKAKGNSTLAGLRSSELDPTRWCKDPSIGDQAIRLEPGFDRTKIDLDDKIRPPGIDGILRLYRYQAREEFFVGFAQVDWNPTTAWMTWSPFPQSRKEFVSLRDQAPFVGEIEFRIIRDPMEPYTAQVPFAPGETFMVTAIPEIPWSIHLRAPRGGIQAITTTKNIQLPVDGYVREMHLGPFPGGRHLGARTILAYRRAGNPVRYGTIQLLFSWLPPTFVAGHSKAMVVEGTLFLNNANGRWFEYDGETATPAKHDWFRAFTNEERAAYLNEPINPKELPPDAQP